MRKTLIILISVVAVGLEAVGDLVGNGMQSWLMVRSWLFCLVTLVCGEANRCSVTIAVWLVTGNAAVSLPIRRQAISRRRGRTRPASRFMKALTVLLAMPRCRHMRRCMARCNISCSPSWRRAGRRCRRRASTSINTGYRRGCSTRWDYAGRQGVGGAGVSAFAAG